MKYIWLFVILLCGCAGQSFLNVQADYRNVLNISNWPQGIREGVSLFSDLGAWHGFAFIPDSVGGRRFFRSHVYGIQLCRGLLYCGCISGC